MGLPISVIAMSKIPEFLSSNQLKNNENGLKSSNSMFGFMKGCVSKEKDKNLVLGDERVVNFSVKECAKQPNYFGLKDTEEVKLIGNTVAKLDQGKNSDVWQNQTSVISCQDQNQKETNLPQKIANQPLSETLVNSNLQKPSAQSFPQSSSQKDVSKIDNQEIQQSMEIGNQQSSDSNNIEIDNNLQPAQQQISLLQPSRAQAVQQKIEQNSTRIKALSQRAQLLSLQYFESLNSSIQNPNSNHPQLILAQLTQLQQKLIEALSQNQMLENQLNQIQDHQFLPPDEGMVYDGQSTSTLEDSDADFEQ